MPLPDRDPKTNLRKIIMWFGLGVIIEPFDGERPPSSHNHGLPDFESINRGALHIKVL